MKIYKSKKDIKIAGVCAGIAESLNLNALFIRILGIIFALYSLKSAIIIYIALALLLESKGSEKEDSQKFNWRNENTQKDKYSKYFED